MTKKSLPKFVQPMMAESAKAPFDSTDWIFEIKLDGYRAITVFDAAGGHCWSCKPTGREHLGNCKSSGVKLSLAKSAAVAL
jgi:hypothetical protein